MAPVGRDYERLRGGGAVNADALRRALVRGTLALRSPRAPGQRIPGGNREPVQQRPRFMPPPKLYSSSGRDHTAAKR